MTEHLSPAEFHGWFANKSMTIGKQTKPLSEWWIASENRREYEGVVFAPEQDRGLRWYNLWRGFTVKPAETADHPSVEAFKEHALKNVCGGDAKLFNWLMGYFAHMIQKPFEKPLVALVFKGKKGTGKNALVERVGALFKPHFFVADDDRYLLGNFNSHLESCLFLVLDEAAWAGDKKAEGRLKGLITGGEHNIERKGKEPYKVDNLTRVSIIGNEQWLVPASADERRFAVFNVSDGRRQDRKFFHDMRVGMEQGGYAHLLRFLMDIDISDLEVNEAPNTKGLVEQKIASLEAVQKWWFDCLGMGEIAGGDFGGEWPDHIQKARLRAAFNRWAKEHNVRQWLPDEKSFGRDLKAVAASLQDTRRREGGKLHYFYTVQPLEHMRREFEQVLGGKLEWDTP